MITKRIIVTGTVQGVGFRPFVYNKALALGVSGHVLNTSRAVEIVAQGTEQAVAGLVAALRGSPPPRSRIESIEIETVAEAEPLAGFTIRDSRVGGERTVRLAPDLALCSECRAELFNPNDRRYLYPYINCTNCGPRFTIVRDIPYDRANTTMSSFPMCPACAAEYADPANRRFHAQPNACHACGPHISLTDNRGGVIMNGENADAMNRLIDQAAQLLRQGAIIGIKGLGGFHLACRADDGKAVAELRRRKQREEKPLAVMVKDAAAAGRFVILTQDDEKRLSDVDAPIVLLPKKPGPGIAEEVAPRSSTFGILFPYTPLQHVLFSRIDFPLVMTSANVSDEPIVFRNDEALGRLASICDYFIPGERDIHTCADDSVLRRIGARDYPIRRSRGFVPAPLRLAAPLTHPVLAVGAELKNTICLAHRDAAYLSQHIGDLKNRETYRLFVATIGHFLKLHEIRPTLVAHDLHPQYLSSQFVLDPPEEFEWLAGILKIPVQHHHAHIAGCLAEHGLAGPAIGVALDGTGLGPDGTVWGGEVLVADLYRYERRAHLATVAMPGGDLAVREPWRMALAYLAAVYGEVWRDMLTGPLAALPEQKLVVTVAQLHASTRLPVTSSCGRLFDALAALSGVCLEARYEGQPAIEFEQAGQGDDDGEAYRFSVDKSSAGLVIGWQDVFREVVADCRRGKTAAVVSGRFHRGLIEALSETVSRVARETRLKDVVLSGGCFMNMILLEGLVVKLNNLGLNPIVHERVPCNDGGVALGQAAVAAANAG